MSAPFKRRAYVLPVSPVTLNNAYEVSGPRRYVADYVRAMQTAVQTILAEQDARRGGPPRGTYFGVDWYFLYPPEHFFAPARVSERRDEGGIDDLLQECDVSNLVKLIEDALFTYIGRSDTRVARLSAEKLPVRRLPVTPMVYDLAAIAPVPGNTVIVVRELPASYFADRGSRLMREIPELRGTNFLPYRSDVENVVRPSRLPAWYTHAEDQDFRGSVDPEALALAYDAAAGQDLVQLRVLALARAARFGFLARHLDMEPTDEAVAKELWFQRLIRLRRAYKLCSRPGYPDADFFGSRWWIAEALEAETSAGYAKRFNALRALDGRGKRVLVLPSFAGAESRAFRFAEQVDVYTPPAALDFVRARLDAIEGGSSNVTLWPVADGGRSLEPPTEGLAEYDVVVCPDYVDLVSDPRDAVARLLRQLKPDGVLALTYTFKAKREDQALPWVHAGRMDGQPVRLTFQRYLLSRRVGLGLDLVDGSSFGDDVRLLRRHTSET